MSSPNLKMLETVARALGSFTQEVVFVGGATVSLYLQNPASPEVRPTDDVDCFIELSSYSSYADIEERMRKLGFEHDMSRGAPICRWLVGDIKVDVMPTEGAILGFTNRWYQSGVAHKIPFLLPDGQNIFILSAPFFVATKLEAFLSRGHDDYRFSSDLEDIITVIDGRETLLAEVQAAPADLIAYLARHFGSFFKNRDFHEGLEGFLPASREGKGRQKRALAVVEHLKENKGAIDYKRLNIKLKEKI